MTSDLIIQDCGKAGLSLKGRVSEDEFWIFEREFEQLAEALAKAIEARRAAATKIDAVHESAAPKAFAQKGSA